MKFSWLIALIVSVASLSMGWGAYRTALDNQNARINEQQQVIQSLQKDMGQLHSDLSRLSQALEDFKTELAASAARQGR